MRFGGGMQTPLKSGNYSNGDDLDSLVVYDRLSLETE